MAALKLRNYLDIRGITASDLSKEIGASKQNISNWIKDGATVEMLDNGGIKILNEKVVHETQVAKS